MLNPIYRWLAAALVLLTVVGVIYGKGRLDASHKASLADLTFQLKVASHVAARERDARAVDLINYSAAEARLSVLDHEISELTTYANQLEDADRECLSGADTDRLRLLWP